MKKRILRIIIITFTMLCLLSGGAALAVTFGFNTEETGYDNTISDTNGAYTLQITSSSPEDFVTNWTMDTAVGELGFTVSSMDGFAVCVTGLSGNEKPDGMVTVSLAGGKAFSVNSFMCGNSGADDYLTITTGSTTESFPVAGFSETLITPSSAFYGITSFTLGWDEFGTDNYHAMYFDNFIITFNPVITTQPSNASVASGGNTAFSVAATGDSLIYQWQVFVSGSGSGFTNVINDGLYSGATTASLSIIGAIKGMNQNQYRCIVTSDGASTTSDSATLTILNQSPTDITLDPASIEENTASGTKVGELTTTDPDSSTFTYSLVDAGAYPHNTSFTISGSDLLLNTVPDFETTSSYSICIQTEDNTGLTYDEVFTITITDENEAPTEINLSSSSVPEHSAIGTAIGTLSCVDPDTGSAFTYSFIAGEGDTDNGSFSIDGTTLKLGIVPDYESKSNYSIRARVSDGSLTYDQQITIAITDENDAPTDISLSSSSILEHCAIGTAVVTLSSADQDGGAFTYSLAPGDGAMDNGSFIISGNSLQVAVSPDFEAKNNLSIRIRTTDSSGLYYEKILTIEVTDGDDPPTDISITSQSIAENSASGTAIGTLSSTDTGASVTFTYSLVSGSGDTNNASFMIAGNELKLAVVPDYETKNSYSIRISTTDESAFYYEKVFTISITNMNEAPTDIALSNTSIAENTAIDATVGTLLGTDPDVESSFTYTMAAGAGDTDNSSFTITGNELKLAEVPDYETKPGYSIRIRVSDGGLTYEKQFTITVLDGNDAPTDITLSSTSVAENTASGTTAATIDTSDPNGGNFTYSLVNGAGSTDNSSFTISGDSLRLAIAPDYENKSSYEIRIRTTDDGGMYCEEAFTISITDVNEVPTNIVLSNNNVSENNPSGTAIGTLSGTDPDAGSAFTYSLVSGSGDEDNVSFMITGSALQSAAVFNCEAKDSYSIRIRIIDAGGLWYEKQFTISVIPASIPVTGITVTGTGGASSLRAGSTLQMLAGVSPADATNNSVTWSIASGSGATISADGLLTATAAGLVTVRATANDGSGVYGERAITITSAPSGGGGGNPPTTPTYNAEVESGTGSDTTLPVTIDKDNGSAGVEVGSGNGLMSEGKTAVITVPSITDVNTYTVGIPVPDLSTSDEQGNLSFNTGAGSVTVPSNMLTGVIGISGARAEIAIGQGDKARLPEDVKAAIGDKPLIQLTLSIDGRQMSWGNPDAPVTVNIPYTPTAAELANPESIVIWYIDGSGKVVNIPNGHYDPATSMVTFDTTHFSDYAVAYNPVSFSDVAANAWYSKAVRFIAAREITSGTNNGNYSPEAKLTRGECIVLMMRAYGIAPDENPADNFSDAGSTSYTGYLAAAKRLGISAGAGNNMYAPGREITRQEMFALLYNTLKVIGQLPETHGQATAAGSDQAVSEADDQPQGDFGKTLSDFIDMGDIDSWATEAMATFVATGTVGGNGGKLTPNGATTRAEMAQVLYNLLGK